MSEDILKLQTVSTRIPEQTYRILSEKAAVDGVRISDVIRTAIADYLEKDIILEEQVLANMNVLDKGIKRVLKEVNVFSKLWLYWTQYFFMFQKGIGELSDDEKRKIMEDGKRRQKAMIDAFRQQCRDTPSLMESIIADYLTDSGEQ